MLPATNTIQPTARHESREAQILALLTERRGEKLTASAVATVLQAGGVENVRSALQRLHARHEIAKDHEVRTYRVGNSQCKHRAALWFVP